MADEIVLYSYNISPYAAKVRAALRWKGLSYREEIVHPARRRIVRKLSGQSLIPVLVDAGGRVVHDSTRILAYLDEKYPERSLTPADPLLRARARLLDECADEGCARGAQPVRWLIPGNFARVSARMRAAYPQNDAGEDLFFGLVARLVRREMARRFGPRFGPGRPATYLNRLAEVLDTLDGAILPGGWLVGEEPTVADIAVAAWIALLRGLDGWETVKMRRKVAKLAKALVPEEEPGKEIRAAPQYKEAYDPEDQAMIEASRLRRAAKGQ